MSHLYHFNFGGDALGSSGTNIWKIRDTGRPKMITIKAITCIILIESSNPVCESDSHSRFPLHALPLSSMVGYDGIYLPRISTYH